MTGPKCLAVTFVIMVGAALAACGGPHATPKQSAAPVLTDKWQQVAIGNSETCPDKLACLVGLSKTDHPTTVSIRQVSFANVRGVEACMPKVLPPGLTSEMTSFEAYTIEAQASGVPDACPAVRADRAAQQPNEEWRRADSRDPFEAQNALSYSFLPFGSSEGDGGRNVRCIVLYDPSGSSGPAPAIALQAAAETCVTLFYFRERQ